MVAKTSQIWADMNGWLSGVFRMICLSLNGCEDINGYEQTRMGGCQEGFR